MLHLSLCPCKTFFTNKTKTISSQFSPPLTQDPQPTRSTAQTPIFSFCPLTEAEVSKLLLSSHPTTLVSSLHWLPVAARIQFKTLMLAYRTITGSAPTYFHSLLRTYIPSRSLRSASERRLVVPSQRDSKSLSRTFSFTAPGRWNDLPTPIRNAGSLSIFKQQLKTHLFQLYLTI